MPHRGGSPQFRLMTWVIVVVLVFSLTGCSLFSRAAAQPPDPQQVQKIAEASNGLAFDLLRRLSDSAHGDNVVISPLSISALLAMLLEGSGGETAEAIAGVLHLDLQDEDNSGFGDLLRYLSHSVEDVELNVANAIWTTTGYPLTDEFTKTMKDSFEAQVAEADLGSTEAAETIDSWVADKTNNRIEKMSDALGLPDPAAVAVLLNAVYFKGTWTNQFDPNRTQPGTFTLPDSTEVEVPMMSQQAEFETAQGSRFILVRLPYGTNERFVMDILLPDADYTINDFVADLNPDMRAQAIDDLSKGMIYLQLPKFELEYKATAELDAVLQDLGMAIAYSPESDFTPMSPRDPWLSRVAHKTYIRVDEEGSEAAGVTGGVMLESAPAPLEVNRPFVLTIADTETNTILFMGVVTDPRE